MIAFLSPSPFLPSTQPLLPSLCRTPSRRFLRVVCAAPSSSSAIIRRATALRVPPPLAERVVSLAQHAARTWSLQVSDFLTPPDGLALLRTMSDVRDLRVALWGGYEDADRKVLLMAHVDMVEEEQALVKMAMDEGLIKGVMYEGAFEGKVGHRDFLGAVLGVGIKREMVGDVIVTPEKVQVIVKGEMSDVILTVGQVGNVKVSAHEFNVDDVQVPEKRIKQVCTVEASMRLDAVASAGLGVSRSKVADMAKSGLVFVNYKEVRVPAKNVHEGDVVAVRGIGKMEIAEVGRTSKGRFRVNMKRYV